MPKGIKGFQSGEQNPMWKGDGVGIEGVHDYVASYLSKPTKCSNCHKNKHLDMANISQEYKRDLDDWEWLCRSCHMTKDGRMKNLKRSAPFGKDNPNWKHGKYSVI
jgi:hypothetical protein